MLDKILVLTERGNSLELSLTGSELGYLIKEVDGLAPNNATIVSSSFALMDGEEHQGSQGEKRNIRIQLGYDMFHPSSVQVRRNKLYGFFMPKSKIKLRIFMEGMVPVNIDGVVESFDTALFTKEPQVIISVICHKPAFLSQEIKVVSASTTSTSNGQTVSYEGSIETGFVFKMLVTRPISNFALHSNFANGEGSSLEVSANFLVGDLIEFETLEGNKSASLTRSGVKSSILYAVSPNSDWIELYPGDNTIRVYVEGAPIPYTIEYVEKFGGL